MASDHTNSDPKATDKKVQHDDINGNKISIVTAQLQVLVKDVKECKSLLEVLVARSQETAKSPAHESISRELINKPFLAPTVLSFPPSTTNTLSTVPPQGQYSKNRSANSRRGIPSSTMPVKDGKKESGEAQKETGQKKDLSWAERLYERTQAWEREKRRDAETREVGRRRREVEQMEEEIPAPPKGIYPFPKMYD